VAVTHRTRPCEPLAARKSKAATPGGVPSHDGAPSSGHATTQHPFSRVLDYSSTLDRSLGGDGKLWTYRDREFDVLGVGLTRDAIRVVVQEGIGPNLGTWSGAWIRDLLPGEPVPTPEALANRLGVAVRAARDGPDVLLQARMIVTAGSGQTLVVARASAVRATAAQRIAAELRAAILAECLRAGDRLPSAEQLALRPGVSETTVWKAVRLLLHEGRIVGGPGRPWVIADDGPPQPTAVVRARQELRAAFEAGEFEAGQPLPTMKALGARFGVSATTMLLALQPLRDEGVVVGGGRGRTLTIARRARRSAGRSREGRYLIHETDILALIERWGPTRG
jgi:DNA-binding transcriptional regulator YhcF (GntR family)